MGAIQVKNVPEELHAAIRSRAAEEGTTVSEYVLDLIRRDLQMPTMRQWIARVRSREPVRSSIDVVELLHQLREERERELMRRMGRPTLPETDDAEK